MSKSKTVIASTFGFDIAEMEDYRYQPTRTNQPVYSIGEHYYAVSNKKPTADVGKEWVKHNDQFFAEKQKTILWVTTA